MNFKRAFHIFTLVVLVAFGFLASPGPVSGAALFVTTFADEFGPDYGTGCSLREAIWAANNDTPYGGCPGGSGADTITLKPGLYKLERSGTDDTATAGDLDITQSLTIIGAGMKDATTGSVIYANQAEFSDRIFHIIKPVGATLNVSISNVRIQGGYTNQVRGGGGILIEGATVNMYRVFLSGNFASRQGGGITNYNGSTLKVSFSIFTANNTGSVGGAVYNVGNLTLENSILVSNSANGNGGGLDNGTGSTAVVRNTTITKNITDTMLEEETDAGGISNAGQLTLINNTIAENDGIGLLVESTAKTTIANTILASNSRVNCARRTSTVSVTSSGYNINHGSGALPKNKVVCGYSGPGDSTANPLLSPLFYDESVTQTFGFSDKNSPAVDAIPPANTNCPTTDQRMHGRWADGNEDGKVGCDIGAYELGGDLFVNHMPVLGR